MVAALAERYRRVPQAASFRLIVFPMVGWIYVGGAVALLGGLLALWPAPDARLRRIQSAYAARLRGDLARL